MFSNRILEPEYCPGSLKKKLQNLKVGGVRNKTEEVTEGQLIAKSKARFEKTRTLSQYVANT